MHLRCDGRGQQADWRRISHSRRLYDGGAIRQAAAGEEAGLDIGGVERSSRMNHRITDRPRLLVLQDLVKDAGAIRWERS